MTAFKDVSYYWGDLYYDCHEGERWRRCTEDSDGCTLYRFYRMEDGQPWFFGEIEIAGPQCGDVEFVHREFLKNGEMKSYEQIG